MATVRERIAAAKLEDQRIAQTGGRSVRDRIAAAKEQEREFTQADHVKTVSQVRQARAAEKPASAKMSSRTALVFPPIVDVSSGGRNIEPVENPYLTALNRFRQSRETPDAVTGAAPSGATARSAGRSGSFGGGTKKAVDAGFTGGRKTAEERADWGKIAAGTAYGGLQQFKKTALSSGIDASARLLDLLGLPAYNIKRDVYAILQHALIDAGEEELLYELDKLMSNPEKDSKTLDLLRN